MEAIEKAKQLIDRYTKEVEITFKASAFSPIETFTLTEMEAKQCALILVDEIINNSRHMIPILKESSELVCSEKYWNEVKNEIEKL